MTIGVHDPGASPVIKEKLTEFRRFLAGTVGPHAKAHPGDKWAKYIVAQLNAIESNLDTIHNYH